MGPAGVILILNIVTRRWGCKVTINKPEKNRSKPNYIYKPKQQKKVK
jgi:hypothetical protein